MKRLYTNLLLMLMFATTAFIPEQAAAYTAADSAQMVTDGDIVYIRRPFPFREYSVVGFVNGKSSSSVVIPDSVLEPMSGVYFYVTRVEPKAFADNKEVTSVNLPRHLAVICDSAFAGTSITDVVIPHMVDSIDADAFKGDPIKTVTIQSPDQSNWKKTDKLVIEDGAFDNSPADSFTDCYVEYPDAPPITDKAFPNASHAVIHLPSTLTDTQEKAYEEGEGWKEFIYHPDITAIDKVETDDSDTPCEYFTLTGLSVNPSNLAPGLYIVRHGSKVVKTLIY